MQLATIATSDHTTKNTNRKNKNKKRKTNKKNSTHITKKKGTINNYPCSTIPTAL